MVKGFEEHPIQRSSSQSWKLEFVNAPAAYAALGIAGTEGSDASSWLSLDYDGVLYVAPGKPNRLIIPWRW